MITSPRYVCIPKAKQLSHAHARGSLSSRGGAVTYMGTKRHSRFTLPEFEEAKNGTPLTSQPLIGSGLASPHSWGLTEAVRQSYKLIESRYWVILSHDGWWCDWSIGEKPYIVNSYKSRWPSVMKTRGHAKNLDRYHLGFRQNKNHVTIYHMFIVNPKQEPGTSTATVSV